MARIKGSKNKPKPHVVTEAELRAREVEVQLERSKERARVMDELKQNPSLIDAGIRRAIIDAHLKENPPLTFDNLPKNQVLFELTDGTSQKIIDKLQKLGEKIPFTNYREFVNNLLNAALDQYLEKI